MSSLNSFKILSYQNALLEVEVKMIHPDEHHINDSTNFALQIILELYEKIRNEHIYNSNWQQFPFSKEEGLNLFNSLSKEELNGLLKVMRWEEEEIDEATYNTILETSNFILNGKTFTNFGMQDGIYKVYYETDYDAFCELADYYIEQVEVMSVSHFPHWNARLETYLEYGKLGYGFDNEVYDRFENEPAPAYVLRISVNPEKASLFSYLQPNCYWESAAFNYASYSKEYRSTKRSIYHTLYYDCPNEETEEQTLWNWWKQLPENWQHCLLDNLSVQKFQLFPSIKSQYHAMIFKFVLEDQFGKERLDEYHDIPVTIEQLRLVIKMKILYTSGYDLKSLEPVKTMKHIKILLSESGNEFTDLSPLAHLTELEELQISLISDTKPSTEVMQKLEKLRILYFDPATIEEVTSLKNLPQLRELNFIAFFEVDAAVFIDFPALKKLSVSECGGMDDPIKQENIQKLRDKGIEVIWEVEGENYEIINY